MNIFIFIRTPATGGLEKQALELYSLLSGHGHNVNFIYVYSTPSFISPWKSIDFPRNTPSLSKYSKPLSFFSFISLSFRLTRQLLSQYNPISGSSPLLIAFGTKENLIALLSRVMIFASTFRTFPLIISERNHPKYSYNSTSLSLLRYLLYPLADFLHVQTTSIKTWFKYNSLLPSSRVSVIPNIIPQTFTNTKRYHCFDSHNSSIVNILLVGNKPYQKGFDFLLDNFIKLQDRLKDNDHSLTYEFSIYGSDTNFSETQSFPFSGLEANYYALPPHCQSLLHFKGKNSTLKIFSEPYDCFLLLSRYEGYPNVLLESIFNSLLPIVYAGDYGVIELVGRDYPLVFYDLTIESLGKAIQLFTLLTFSQKRTLILDLKSRILSHSSRKHIYSLWDNLISTASLD